MSGRGRSARFTSLFKRRENQDVSNPLSFEFLKIYIPSHCPALCIETFVTWIYELDGSRMTKDLAGCYPIVVFLRAQSGSHP